MRLHGHVAGSYGWLPAASRYGLCTEQRLPLLLPCVTGYNMPALTAALGRQHGGRKALRPVSAYELGAGMMANAPRLEMSIRARHRRKDSWTPGPRPPLPSGH
eukprot:COSAG01_NODE_6667_length_3555_cov_33.351273_6_plen_103_part_00